MIRAALLGSLIVAGACSLYDASLHGWEYYQLLAADRTAVGRVIDSRTLDADADYGHTVLFSYRYRKSENGGPTTILREQGVENATYRSLRRGDPVRVVYWSADPTRVHLEGNHASLPRALSRGAVGAFFLGVGAWGFGRRGAGFLALRRRKPPAA